MENNLLGIDFTNTYNALMEFAEKVHSKYQDNLKESRRNTSEMNLSNSIKHNVRIENREFVVELQLNHYWYYIENGTKPHWVSAKILEHWINVKPLIPEPNINGEIPTPKQLSYMIQNKIAEKGTEGIPDLGNAENDMYNELKEVIDNAIDKDIEKYSTKIIKPLLDISF